MTHENGKGRGHSFGMWLLSPMVVDYPFSRSMEVGEAPDLYYPRSGGRRNSSYNLNHRWKINNKTEQQKREEMISSKLWGSFSNRQKRRIRRAVMENDDIL